jgi:hypothetical protein
VAGVERECRIIGGVEHFWCTRCQRWLPRTAFGPPPPGRGIKCGVRSHCKECENKARNARRKFHPARRRSDTGHLDGRSSRIRKPQLAEAAADQCRASDAEAERTIEDVTLLFNYREGLNLHIRTVQAILRRAQRKIRAALEGELREAV